MIVKSAAAFLFDMDGTLINSSQAMRRIWGRWARWRGVDFAALFPVVQGRRAIDTMRLLALPGLDPDAEAAIIDREEVEDVEGVVAIAGAAEFLASLPPERWTVVTSAPRALAQARLGAAGLPVPETILTAEEVLVGKPAPDCYILGAKRLGYAPQECLVFEDSDVGVESAVAAGADVLVVASAQSQASLSGRSAVADFDELDLTVTPDRLRLRRRVS